MKEVKFSAYRQYLEQRQTVNTAVMALLAGSQLASHTLMLTSGSERTMQEIFPRIPHIGRFNLKPQTAQESLSHAESHLSAMAIPYIIAVQEALFGTYETMLVNCGNLPKRKPRDRTSPVWVVRNHWQQIGETLDGPSWDLFEVLAELRHDIIHRAGAAGQRLVGRATTISSQAQSLWSRVSGGDPFPSFTLSQKHMLGHADMVVTLAVVKFLATEGNMIMQRVYPRNSWLDEFVDDAASSLKLQGNNDQRFRLARGYARMNYAPLQFTEQEIRQALSL